MIAELQKENDEDNDYTKAIISSSYDGSQQQHAPQVAKSRRSIQMMLKSPETMENYKQLAEQRSGQVTIGGGIKQEEGKLSFEKVRRRGISSNYVENDDEVLEDENALETQLLDQEAITETDMMNGKQLQ